MIQRDTRFDGPAAVVQRQPVPVAAMVENIVGCKWSVRLLQLCAEGHHRPSAFLRACEGLSTKVMNERLQKMIRFGILERRAFGEKPPIEVEYRFTPFGNRFMGILEEVRRLQAAVDDGVPGVLEQTSDASLGPRLPAP
ncbi:MAG: winged helix-turn-helix transcriptional regulator [Gemmatimonadaceae bacterium]|nr:winged helix-turn-helix transcriptional regulator [Gemmatimonadaceae bacterium]